MSGHATSSPALSPYDRRSASRSNQHRTDLPREHVPPQAGSAGGRVRRRGNRLHNQCAIAVFPVRLEIGKRLSPLEAGKGRRASPVTVRIARRTASACISRRRVEQGLRAPRGETEQPCSLPPAVSALATKARPAVNPPLAGDPHPAAGAAAGGSPRRPPSIRRVLPGRSGSQAMPSARFPADAPGDTSLPSALPDHAREQPIEKSPINCRRR